MLIGGAAEATLEEGEEIKLAQRVQLFTGADRSAGTGTFTVTTSRVVWTPDGDAASGGFSLYYPAIVMHAVSRDMSQFHSSCLYLQLDGEQSLRELTGGSRDGTADADAAEPMDTGGHAAANGVSGERAEGQAEEGEEEEEGDEEGDEPLEEVRLVPVGTREEEGGLDGALEALFKALSEGAALNPDDDDDDDDDDEVGGGFGGGGGFFTAESFAGAENGASIVGLTDAFGTEQMLSLEGATPEQLAMLERYDAMLEASGSLQVNNDGRFDDAEEDEAPPQEPTRQ